MVATVKSIPSPSLPVVMSSGQIHPVWYEYFRTFGEAVIETDIFDATDFTVASSITINDTGIDHDATTNFLANEHIDWTNTTESFSTSGSLQVGNINIDGNTIMATDTDGNITLVPNGTGNIDIYDPGAEAAGIDIGGTVYSNALRVNDFGGANVGMLHLHKHSTTLPNAIVGSRSKSDTTAHANVAGNDQLLRIIGTGWTGTHYDMFGDIIVRASNEGTISTTSSPGKINIRVTPDGSNAPANAIVIDQDKSVDFSGHIKKEVGSGITASTTQTQGQQALTDDINEISTVANANDVVTLPTAAAGLGIVVINNGANTLQIFPASGDDLGAGVDTSTTLASGSNTQYVAYDTTNWEVI